MKTSRYAAVLVALSLVGCGVVAPLDDVDPGTGSGIAGGGGGQSGAGGSSAQGGAGAGQSGAGQSGAGQSGAGQSGAGAGGDAAGTGGEGGAGAGGDAGGAGGDAGVAGESGSAGSAGDGGAGGESGSSGQGGAGQAGIAGSAGSAGSGGSPPDESLGTLGGACPVPGKLACNGHAQPLALICGPDSKWIVNTTCSNGQLCESTGPFAGTCADLVPECKGKLPGEASCSGADRVVCGVDLTSSTKETCQSAQHCQQSTGATCAKCLDGEFLCNGVALSKCADDNLSTVPVQDCATEAQCNAGAGACTDSVCVEGQHKCDGDLLQECNAAEDGYTNKETCAPGLCDAINKHCNVCVAGSSTCKDDKTVESCSSDGLLLSQSACEGGTPQCDSGKCVACKGDSDCPASTNECQKAACVLGACVLNPVLKGTPIAAQTVGDCLKIACDGNGGQLPESDDGDVPNDDGNSCTTEQCKSGVPEFAPVAKDTPCEGGEKCDGFGTCGTCSEGDKRCLAGNKPQVCNDKGVFVDGTACGGATPQCSAGVCVQCLNDAQCTASDECQAPVCNSGTCGTTGKPLGTPVAEQPPGDCKTAVCDGNGGKTTQPNISDLPTSSNECATASCDTSGNPTSPPRPPGTACGSGGVCNGAGVCGVCVPGARQCSGNGIQACGNDGQWGPATACGGDTPYCAAGNCVECLQADQCKAAGECRNAACNSSNSCVYTDKGQGAPAATQTANDCKKNVCLAGNVSSESDSSDPPVDDNKECTDQACVNGVPTTTNKASGVACSQGVCDGLGTCGTCTPGAKRCGATGLPEVCANGGVWQPQAACSGKAKFCSEGDCVQCLQADQCAVDNECQLPVCSKGECDKSFKSKGTPTSTQTLGDCQTGICDGDGNLSFDADDTDLPADDNNECTDQACSGGAPKTTNSAAGKPCNGNAGVCSGTGTCGACVPTSKRCSSAGKPEICTAEGQWVANGSCGTGAPLCSAGNCVQCLANSDCSAQPGCQTGTCTASNTCSYTNKPTSQTCGDGIKCSFETCDDGDKTNCGFCNAACNGFGNGLPLSTCEDSCSSSSSPPDIVGSSLVGCNAKTVFTKRDLTCNASQGWETAPAEAWLRWRGSLAPTHNYWTDNALNQDNGVTNQCKVSTAIVGYQNCSTSPARLCTSTGGDAEGNTCSPAYNCGYEANSPNQFLGGGCGSGTTAGALCWRNPCADGTVEQIFPNGMAGCSGSTTFAKRALLCGAGYHVCSALEYVSRRKGTVPNRVYWTDSDLKLNGTLNANCFAGTTGTTCSAGSMRVCPNGNAGFPVNYTDPDGNQCNLTSCGLGTAAPNQFFGGCGSDSAGSLCCADSPCADGTVEQVFSDGMVGCSGSVSFPNRQTLCGDGYHTATLSDWSKYNAGIIPAFHYWTDTDLALNNGAVDGTCNANTTGSSGYTACSAANGPAHVCSPNNTAVGHKDSAQNQCANVNCGYKTNTPNAYLGGCSSNGAASTLCIPD